MNFVELSNIIFVNKKLYGTISDKDKIDNFYIINKKLSLGNLQLSQFFNHKFIDRASALDLYYMYFRKTNKLPNYWWAKSPNKKEKVKKVPNADRVMFIEYEGLTEKEFNFLYEHYQEDVEYKIKLLKRLAD